LYDYKGENIVIFDLPRSLEDNMNEIYSSMESLKNGSFLSTKYKSVRKGFPSPHVITIANFKPDSDKLSKDRIKFMFTD